MEEEEGGGEDWPEQGNFLELSSNKLLNPSLVEVRG